MPIVITRVGDLYEGTVTPSHGGDSPWSSLQPMTAGSLIDALRDLGCHHTDVLAGISLNAAVGWWWADPAAGLVIVYYAVREAHHILTDHTGSD